MFSYCYTETEQYAISNPSYVLILLKQKNDTRREKNIYTETMVEKNSAICEEKILNELTELIRGGVGMTQTS